MAIDSYSTLGLLLRTCSNTIKTGTTHLSLQLHCESFRFPSSACKSQHSSLVWQHFCLLRLEVLLIVPSRWRSCSTFSYRVTYHSTLFRLVQYNAMKRHLFLSFVHIIRPSPTISTPQMQPKWHLLLRTMATPQKAMLLMSLTPKLIRLSPSTVCGIAK